MWLISAKWVMTKWTHKLVHLMYSRYWETYRNDSKQYIANAKTQRNHFLSGPPHPPKVHWWQWQAPRKIILQSKYRHFLLITLHAVDLQHLVHTSTSCWSRYWSPETQLPSRKSRHPTMVGLLWWGSHWWNSRSCHTTISRGTVQILLETWAQACKTCSKESSNSPWGIFQTGNQFFGGTRNSRRGYWAYRLGQFICYSGKRCSNQHQQPPCSHSIKRK